MKKTVVDIKRAGLIAVGALLLNACATDTPAIDSRSASLPYAEYYGTQEPWARENIYFAMTDRFVDGDPNNNHEDQGGDNPTFQRPLQGPDGQVDYVGYMGGDFKGLLQHADYIRNLGFTALWITPIVDNPDEAFAGGSPVAFAQGGDGGKTGYHGYWGNNFYVVDEHLESEGLTFEQFTRALRNDHDIKLVLDVVGNHGSPAFDMAEQQPGFGQVFDRDGRLIADHQNLYPQDLDPNNPLHQFFRTERDIAELASFDPDNPAVMDYVVGAYLQWIEQGAAAFRIDTIKHQPHKFWREFAERIRAEHPGFFMFGESFSWDAAFIAEHTYLKNGGISVLDFPGREAMIDVFENSDSDFSRLLDYLHLESGLYQNPYELATFYDNHDMSRMNADTAGFINANNWLFTSRGIPVLYYGSEIGFMAGTSEHEGNRNYYGVDNIAKAQGHPIAESLRRVAHMRLNAVALQKGLQVNLDFDGQTASFLRVHQQGDKAQTALVLLNKGEETARFNVPGDWLNTGNWQELNGKAKMYLANTQNSLTLDVPANGVRVLLFNAPVNNPALAERLSHLQAAAVRTSE